jgi:hypothetical protein
MHLHHDGHVCGVQAVDADIQALKREVKALRRALGLAEGDRILYEQRMLVAVADCEAADAAAAQAAQKAQEAADNERALLVSPLRLRLKPACPVIPFKPHVLPAQHLKNCSSTVPVVTESPFLILQGIASNLQMEVYTLEDWCLNNTGARASPLPHFGPVMVHLFDLHFMDSAFCKKSTVLYAAHSCQRCNA